MTIAAPLPSDTDAGCCGPAEVGRAGREHRGRWVHHRVVDGAGEQAARNLRRE